MLFNSLQFLIFFILVTILYFLLAHRYRWALLLAASCYFYMAFVPIYILILGVTIVVDYAAGMYIEQARGKRRTVFLLISLAANIGVLAIFKYYNFINQNLGFLLQGFALENPIPYLSILLPIGLSFHTFQAMSYTIEVYRGHQKAERHFGIYSLYVMFYPQLVAGPIERPQNLLHQFREEHFFSRANMKSGLIQMATGLFKKVVIADRLAIAVDYSFQQYETQSGLSLMIAAVLYSFQIYCDFSGYSDMAIGSARVMGFTLMDNFNAPYFSSSVAEFWKRWHMSLSTWFKDYVYIPLGGNRVGTVRSYMNLFVVFLISGLWHGASWTFLIWGALHGMFMVAEKAVYEIGHFIRIRIDPFFIQTVKVVSTFLLITFAWIFFRAPHAEEALYILSRMADVSFADIIDLKMNKAELVFSFALIAGLLVKDARLVTLDIQKRNVFVCTMGILLFSCYLFGVFDHKQFIYFQF